MMTTFRSLLTGTVATRILCAIIGSWLLHNSGGTALATARPSTDISPEPFLVASPPGAVASLPAFTPLLAQASPDGPIETFLRFLAQIFLIIGAILIAYGGYEISRGRVVEGLLCILGGLLLALAIPTMKWLIHVASSGA